MGRNEIVDGSGVTLVSCGKGKRHYTLVWRGCLYLL